MQGHESDIVLLDWVCGEADGLGFLKDDRRINVGLTRARSSLIVLYREGLSEVPDSHKRQKRGRVSQVVEHWTKLIRNNRTIEVSYKDDTQQREEQQGEEEGGDKGFSVPAGSWNHDEELQGHGNEETW
jgi:superfamily I DNA and/or RNA helicase